jgi:hypothetical protein
VAPRTLISSIRPASGQKVREVKRCKNRVHLDIHVRDQERERLVETLVTLGRTVVAI